MNLGFVEGELKGLSNAGDRAVLTRIFRTILRDVRFGHPAGVSPDPMVNMGGGFFYGTTPGVANQEFSIVHDFGRAPYLLIPVLALDDVNSQIVRLKVTRAADANRIYLSSPDVNAPLVVAVEG